MAAGLGFKTFTTGEVLTAANVNGYLMQGILVFANATARNAAITSPQEGQACYLKDTDAVLTYSGSAWVTVGGSGGGGKVLQVVTATTSTATAIYTTTYTDTTITATITPSAASSKILVLIMGNVYKLRVGGIDQAVGVKLLRGATAIFTDDQADYAYVGGSTSSEYSTLLPITYVDSPSTTSATTYKLQGRVSVTSGGSGSDWQAGSVTSTITLLEIGA